jgi:hypothetical protein
MRNEMMNFTSDICCAICFDVLRMADLPKFKHASDYRWESIYQYMDYWKVERQ